MSEQSWTVVQFEEDCSVEAVPSTWIQGDFCLWPTYSRDKLMVAIRKHEALNTCWPSYKIKSFRNSTFNDYSKARSKASIAEFTSDLNSEVEDNTKRKRTPKVLSSSSSEESLRTSILPSPPRVKKQNKTIHDKNVKQSLKSAYNPLIQSTSYNTNNNISLPDKDVALSSHEPVLLTSVSCNSTCSCCNRRFDDKTIKNLLTQNYLIRSMVSDVLTEVKEVKLQLLKNQQRNIRSEDQITSIFNNKDLNFPIQTEENLQIVENILEDATEFTNAINELLKIGGNNGYEFVRRSLSIILTNEIAEKYSFFGRKEKKSFCDLNICKIIINASTKGNYCSNSKEAEISIAGWLRRAAERGKKNK